MLMMVSLVKAEEEEEAKCVGSIKHAGRDGLQWVVELGRKAAKLVEIKRSSSAQSFSSDNL